MGYAQEVLADSPLLWWKLDERAGGITIVQTVSGHATSATAVSATLGSTPASGNTLIAVCTGYNGTSWSGSTLTWTQDKFSVWASDTAFLRATSDGSTTAFTFTHNGAAASECWVVLMEVSGLLASPVDQLATVLGANSRTSWSASMAADTNTNELEIFAVSLQGSSAGPTSPSFSNGFTLTSEPGTVSGTRVSLLVGTKIVSTADTPSSSIAWTGSLAACGIGISYKGGPVATDYSGNGNNGLYSTSGILYANGRCPVGVESGLSGLAPVFDGTNGDVISNQSVDSKGIAVEMWFRWREPYNNDAKQLMEWANTNTTPGVFIVPCTSGGLFRVGWFDGTDYDTSELAFSPPVYTWTHIVLNIDTTLATGQKTGPYINGQIVPYTKAFESSQARFIVNTSAPIKLAGSNAGANQSPCEVSNFSVYTHALTPGRIEAHYLASYKQFQGRDLRRRR